VEVAITRYPDAEKAIHGLVFTDRNWLRRSCKQTGGKPVKLIKEELNSIGDEAFVSDVRGSEAVSLELGAYREHKVFLVLKRLEMRFSADNLAHHLFKAMKDK
jgi:hypothetical protein